MIAFAIVLGTAMVVGPTVGAVPTGDPSKPCAVFPNEPDCFAIGNNQYGSQGYLWFDQGNPQLGTGGYVPIPGPWGGSTTHCQGSQECYGVKYASGQPSVFAHVYANTVRVYGYTPGVTYTIEPDNPNTWGQAVTIYGGSYTPTTGQQPTFHIAGPPPQNWVCPATGNNPNC